MQQNNKSIVLAIQASFQKSIDSAISKLRSDLEINTDKINKQQSIMKKDIVIIDEKIHQLQQKCSALKEDNEKLTQEIQSFKETGSCNHIESKTLVLHGMSENPWQSEEHLTNHIIQIFYDALNVDLTGYIEDLNFIGKRGNRRPIKIEFISKQMRKYILENYI